MACTVGQVGAVPLGHQVPGEQEDLVHQAACLIPVVDDQRVHADVKRFDLEMQVRYPAQALGPVIAQGRLRPFSRNRSNARITSRQTALAV